MSTLPISPLSALEAAARAKTRANQRLRDARTALVLAEAEYADAHLAFRLVSGEQTTPPRADFAIAV